MGPEFALPIWFVIWFIVMLYHAANQEGISDKLRTRKRTKGFWERLAVLDKFQLTLQLKPNGQIYAQGDYEGHQLQMESYQKHGDLYSRVTLTTSTRLLPEKTHNREASISKIMTALAIAKTNLPGTIRVEARQGLLIYEQPDTALNMPTLTRVIEMLHQLVTLYPQMLYLGGEIALRLTEEIAPRNKFTQSLVAGLLHNMRILSRLQLGRHAPERLLCPRCLTQFEGRKYKMPGMAFSSAVIYGCRTCGQGRSYLVGDVVATLDEAMTDPVRQGVGLVRVNWLAHRQSFDFDQVRIAQASDEVVERFAVQIGNDTDPLRQSRYPGMRCSLAPTHQLSQNTVKILDSTFGEVVVG